METETTAMQTVEIQSNNLPANLPKNERLSAIPDAWIDRLFLRLSGMYGNRFADMWRGIEIAEVKLCWSQELAEFRGETIGNAIKLLVNNKFPPTLPEFIQHCIDARAANPFKPPTNPLVITHNASYTQDDVIAAKARCMATAARLGMRGFVEKMTTASEII
jgi:hypothetical protein